MEEEDGKGQVDIFRGDDYFMVEVIEEEQDHGTEKGRETKEDKDQPEATRGL